MFLFALVVALRLPVVEGSRPVKPPPRHKAFTVQTTPTYERRPPEPVQVPRERSRRVPVPGPTFEEPATVSTSALSIDPVDVEYIPSDVPFGIPDAPPEPEVPLRVGGEVLAPVKIYGPSPVWPERALRAIRSAVVILEATIDEEGIVQDIRVLKGAPLGLDRAAVDAVRRWRFEPGSLHGRAVAVRYNLTVHFQASR